MPHGKLILRSFVLALLSLSALGALAQTSASTPASPPPQYSPGPIADYNVALPKSTDVLQFRRGERYSIPDPTVPELREDSEAALWDLPDVHFKKNALPFDESDTVLVGTVTAGQTHLSNDKRSIYSEFKVSVAEIIKNSVAPYLQTGAAIDIQRKGGSVRLPSGRVLTRAALEESMPRVGGRYLFFLKYDPTTEDYAIVMGYELDGSEVYRLDSLNFKESNPQINHLLTREGVTESQFLARVKSVFAAQQKKGAN